MPELWYGPGAAAPTEPVAWELPMQPKRKKKRVPSLALILNSVQINNAIVEVSQLKR